MKRFVIVALAVLCAVSAHAISLKWNGTNVVLGTTQSMAFTGSATVALTVTFNKDIDLRRAESVVEGGDRTFASVSNASGSGGSGVYMHVYATNSDSETANGGIGANVGPSGGGTWTPANFAIEAGKAYSLITIFQPSSTAGQTLGQLYLNGSIPTRGSNDVGALGDTLYLNLLSSGWSEGDLTINSAAMYDGALGSDAIAWLASNNTVILPEPTVLALLALGVAGIALKRKEA